MTATQDLMTGYDPQVADRIAERSIAQARARSHAEVKRLLDAAWRVLRRSGWWGLKIDSVLREAQLSTRCFYRHFSSKNELLLALLEDEVGRAVDRLERTVARHEDPVDRLTAWVEAVVAFAYRDATGPRTRMFVAQWRELEAEFPAETARCLRYFLRPLVEIIRDGRDRGVFPGADPETAALAIYHLSSGATTDAHGGGWPSCELQQEVVTTFALRALGASAIPG